MSNVWSSSEQIKIFFTEIRERLVFQRIGALASYLSNFILSSDKLTLLFKSVFLMVPPAIDLNTKEDAKKIVLAKLKNVLLILRRLP